jgi:hypothetical protein
MAIAISRAVNLRRFFFMFVPPQNQVFPAGAFILLLLQSTFNILPTKGSFASANTRTAVPTAEKWVPNAKGPPEGGPNFSFVTAASRPAPAGWPNIGL